MKIEREASSAALPAKERQATHTDSADEREIVQGFTALLETVRELRHRCPWDREQTLASASKHLIEEAYETADAITHGGNAEIEDELGDLLVQVLFASNIADEQLGISLANVMRHARSKLIRRHPHVYAGLEAETSGEVIRKWEETKQTERQAAGATSALDGIARALPALIRAQKLGQRAGSAGMDWREISAVLDKVSEEISEIRAALESGSHEHAAEEIGDALLALANAPRFIGHDAESTLSSACDKFIQRFKSMERLAASRNLQLSKLDDHQIEALWQDAKHH
jgi:MazG family protein